MKLTEILNNVKVEWKTLGEVWQKAVKSKFGVKNIKEILATSQNGYICFTSGTKSYFVSQFLVDGEYIFMNDGGFADIKYHNGKAFYTDHTFCFTTSQMNVKFLYYFLKMNQNFINTNYFQGVGLKNLNKNQIANFKIPIPPLEIQEKIAQILTNFSNYATELRTELRLRNKQYEYYRNLLLSKDYLTKLCLKFDENPEIKTATLGEICETIKAGGDLPKEYIKSKEPKDNFIYPIYSNGVGNNALYGYSNSYKIDKKSVTISARGTIGYHEVKEAFFTPIVRLITLIPNCKIITTEFLNYALFTTNIEHYVSGKSSIPQLTIPNLKKIKIPIPPLKVQNEVVRILDKFSEISSNLEKGLPKEIELRQKQYEFYRDLLLNFKKD